MKTSKFFLAALTVMCAMTTVLTACGSDNDDDNNTPRTAEVKGIGAHYTFSVTEQMSQLCDYTITYYGIGGKLETEKVTWAVTNGVATWEKTVSNTTFPATFGIKVSVSVKSDAQLEGVKVDNVYPVTEKLFVEGVTTEGKPAWEKTIYFNGNATSHGSTSGEKLQAYLDVMEGRGGMVNKCYTFDKEGNEIATASIE
jgi:hypothetical protein